MKKAKLDALKKVQELIRFEYMQLHNKPWIIGFSGGKDSTLLTQLVIECILSIAPDERKRKVYIVCNDTLVESPVFQRFVDKTLSLMREDIKALQIPAEVIKTQPNAKETFWVNMIGRGYPAPTPSFRWCMDRLKIKPTTKFIKDKVVEAGEAILLLGVRSAESKARAKRLNKYSQLSNGSHLSQHNDIIGCLIFAPLKDLSTEMVWDVLRRSYAPWGGKHSELLSIYSDASSGDWPFILGKDDAPTSNATLARFGCWTCTVIEKDKSMEYLIESGHGELIPLAKFRKRLKEVSQDPDSRSKTRRNGSYGLGPLTFAARKMLLGELIEIQDRLKAKLISDIEIRIIKEQWSLDESQIILRKMKGAVR